MHQHFHPGGRAIGKEVGLVWSRLAEGFNDPTEQGVDAGPHVEWSSRKPDLINADHRSHSRNQAPHSSAASTGQLTTTVALPRRISIRMSAAGAEFALT
jgi:hypothetical protein